MGKWRPREGKELAQGHIAQHSLDVGGLTFEPGRPRGRGCQLRSSHSPFPLAGFRIPSQYDYFFKNNCTRFKIFHVYVCLYVLSGCLPVLFRTHFLI